MEWTPKGESWVAAKAAIVDIIQKRQVGNNLVWWFFPVVPKHILLTWSFSIEFESNPAIHRGTVLK